MFVVSKWASYQEFVQDGAPKITKACFVNSDRAIIFKFMNTLGLLNQISILNSSPIDKAFFAVPDLLPLVANEKGLRREAGLTRVFPRFSGGNHSCVNHDLSLKRIRWWRRQIICVIAAIRMVVKADHLGRSFTPISELNTETHTLGYLSRMDMWVSRSFDFNEEPRTLRIYNRSSIQKSIFGGISRGIGAFTQFNNFPIELLAVRSLFPLYSSEGFRRNAHVDSGENNIYSSKNRHYPLTMSKPRLRFWSGCATFFIGCFLSLWSGSLLYSRRWAWAALCGSVSLGFIAGGLGLVLSSV